MARLIAIAAFATALVAGIVVQGVTIPRRTYIPVPDDPSAGPCLVRGEDGLARAVPGWHGRYVHPDFPGVRVEINDLGFRDGEDEVAPPPPWMSSVVVLGDSMAFGMGVPLAETFHERLESEGETIAEGGLRVYDAAMPSFSPYESRLFLDEVAPLLRPDLVIITLFENDDLQENWWAVRHQYAANPRAAREDPTAARRSAISRAWRRLDRGRIVDRLARIVGENQQWVAARLADWGLRLHSPPNRVVAAFLKRSPPAFVTEMTDAAVAQLEQIQRDCEGLGAELVVMAVPAAVQADPSMYEQYLSSIPRSRWKEYSRTRFHEDLVRELRGRGLTVVDLLPPTESESRQGRTCYFGEGHWNSHGHALAAEALVPVVSRILQDGSPRTDLSG